MELRPHQTKALESVNEIFENSNKAIVVQPTGVGKTYIALGLFEQNKDKRLVFAAPSTAILWHLKLKIAKEYGVGPEEYKKVFPNLELTTYQQMNADRKKSKTYVEDFTADYVVYDEAHHIADNKWGKNAKDIMTSHPETRFLGLTATPERTDGIDVVEQVFDGNLADEMTLEEAVATRLLKMPDYVNAIYSYKPIIEELEERIEELKEVDPEKYIMLKKDMEKAKKALEKADGMPEIFAKHIQEKDGRFIVFCKDIEHLKKMVETSKKEGWFEGVNANVETLEIHSEEDNETNRRVLKRFKGDFEATDNTLRVLFSVAKINEGIHLDNLSGVIMLRPTKSKIIFRQQLGRTMSISEGAKHTIAFDIVNNIDSFQDMHDFIEQVIQIRIKNNPDISSEDIRQQAMEEFDITSETRDVREILEKVAGGLEADWEEHYLRSVRWREEHGGEAPRINGKDKIEATIYGWERYQKIRYLKQHQDLEEQEIPEEYREKVKKLKELGLEYVPTNYKSPEQHFEIWKAWTLEHGVTPSQNSMDETEKRIAKRIANLIQSMRKHSGQYKEILEEYEQLKAKYGRAKDNKSAEEWFEEWKAWTLEHGVTPNTAADDEKERRIGNGMSGTLKVMKKNPEAYKEVLEEYEKLYAQYGRRREERTKKETFLAWKKWTIEHGVTPNRSKGQSKDTEEYKLARSFSTKLFEMRKNPEKYKEILEEYEKLYAQYGRYKDNKSAEEAFGEWKSWIVAHGVVPSDHSKEIQETKIARRMYFAWRTMKHKPEEYRGILEEYEQLKAKYGRAKDNKSAEEWFEEWKAWTLEHGVTPSGNSMDETEKRIAKGMSNSIQSMRKHSEQYKEILEEYEQLKAKYGRSKLRKLQDEKEQELTETRQLKTQAEQAEELDKKTQETLDVAIDEQSQKPEGPGE